MQTGSLESKEKEKQPSYSESKLEFVKNPVVFEFLGIPQDSKIHESELEAAMQMSTWNWPPSAIWNWPPSGLTTPLFHFLIISDRLLGKVTR